MRLRDRPLFEEIYLGLSNRHWIGDRLRRHEVNKIEAKRRRVTRADLSGIGLAGHEALHQKLTLLGGVLQLLLEREGIPCGLLQLIGHTSSLTLFLPSQLVEGSVP